MDICTYALINFYQLSLSLSLLDTFYVTDAVFCKDLDVLWCYLRYPCIVDDSTLAVLADWLARLKPQQGALYLIQTQENVSFFYLHKAENFSGCMYILVHVC